MVLHNEEGIPLKLVFALISALFAIIMALVGWTQTLQMDRLRSMETRQAQWEQHRVQTNERIAILETMASQNKQDHQEIKDVLGNIGTKLDTIVKATR